VSMRPPSVTDSRSIFRRSDSGEARPEGQESLIDSSTSFDGLFTVGNHLRIEGTAKGEIQCEGTLTVAEGATVSAKVEAANVVVAGALTGEIICRERLQILPSGRVSGTVTTNSLAIQEGALYEGELHMRTTPADTRPQPPAARSAPSAGVRGRTAANGRATEPPPPPAEET
jgi:cytoskeletal protein CcmA (bactofilin family)